MNGDDASSLEAALADHGVQIRREFLEPELCRRVREATLRADGDRATITKADGALMLDERTRRSKRAIVPAACERLVQERLGAITHDLAAHFAVDVTAMERPQFLVYERGDFFVAHQDSVDNTIDQIRLRRVSIVVFLNAHSRLPQPDCYCGGALSFLRLTADVTPDSVRTPVHGEEGMLVAFRSDLVHEVRPVTHGRRHAIVTWLSAPAEQRKR